MPGANNISILFQGSRNYQKCRVRKALHACSPQDSDFHGTFCRERRTLAIIRICNITVGKAEARIMFT
ncbi:hypothetical protein EUGRSUZ_B01337 [Eucalyptus grandis]|uniref:Uncharacterized protein n=2 Tax=Eucalyptus grandis TaxID=71139 RepID=A0ACC3LR31_EUCGR|nr:hypothetical protein EUGRSUZ_B01337 [Eucalyptus grandis]